LCASQQTSIFKLINGGICSTRTHARTHTQFRWQKFYCSWNTSVKLSSTGHTSLRPHYGKSKCILIAVNMFISLQQGAMWFLCYYAHLRNRMTNQLINGNLKYNATVVYDLPEIFQFHWPHYSRQCWHAPESSGRQCPPATASTGWWTSVPAAMGMAKWISFLQLFCMYGKICFKNSH